MRQGLNTFNPFPSSGEGLTPAEKIDLDEVENFDGVPGSTDFGTTVLLKDINTGLVYAKDKDDNVHEVGHPISKDPDNALIDGTDRGRYVPKLVKGKAGEPVVADFGTAKFVFDTVTGIPYVLDATGDPVPVSIGDILAEVIKYNDDATQLGLSPADQNVQKAIEALSIIPEVDGLGEMTRKHEIYRLKADVGENKAGYYAVDSTGVVRAISKPQDYMIWKPDTHYIKDQIFFFEAINGVLDAQGKKLKAPHGYFGRYMADYTTPSHSLNASEIAKIHTVSNGGSIFRDAVNNIEALRAVTNPSNGETRQDLSSLPRVEFYTFNTNVVSGIAPDDGTKGFWTSTVTPTKSGVGYINKNPNMSLVGVDYETYISAKPTHRSIVSDVVDNSNYSLKLDGAGGSLISDNYIPVDLDREYRASFSVIGKYNGVADSSKRTSHYLGVVTYDSDKKIISPHFLTVRPGSRTTLATALNNGDTTVTIVDATSWFNGATLHKRSFKMHKLRDDGTYGYVGENGRYYDEFGYSRDGRYNAYAEGGIVDNGNGSWTITLSTAWDGGVFPAGTSIDNTYSGGSYNYWISARNELLDAKPHRFSSDWGSDSYDKDVTSYGGFFRNGTAFIKLLMLPNYRTTNLNNSAADGTKTTTWFSKIGLEWRHKPDTSIEQPDFIGIGNTFANLPTTSASGVVSGPGDYVVLSKDDVGNGTIEATQYPRGVYYKQDDGSYKFGYKLNEDVTVLLDTEVADGTITKSGTISPKQLYDRIREIVRELDSTWRNSAHADYATNGTVSFETLDKEYADKKELKLLNTRTKMLFSMHTNGTATYKAQKLTTTDKISIKLSNPTQWEVAALTDFDMPDNSIAFFITTKEEVLLNQPKTITQADLLVMQVESYVGDSNTFPIGKVHGGRFLLANGQDIMMDDAAKYDNATAWMPLHQYIAGEVFTYVPSADGMLDVNGKELIKGVRYFGVYPGGRMSDKDLYLTEVANIETVNPPIKKDKSFDHIIAVSEFAGVTLPAGVAKGEKVLSLDTSDIYISNGDGSYASTNKAEFNQYMELNVKTPKKSYRFDKTTGMFILQANDGGLPKKGILDSTHLLDGEGIYTVRQKDSTIPAATGSQDRLMLINGNKAGAAKTAAENMSFTQDVGTGTNELEWTKEGAPHRDGSNFGVRTRRATIQTDNIDIKNNGTAGMFVDIYNASDTLVSHQTVDAGATNTQGIAAGYWIEVWATQGIDWTVSAPAITTEATLSTMNITDGTETWTTDETDEVIYLVDEKAGKWTRINSTSDGQLGDVKNSVVDIPITDSSIVHDDWSDNPVGIDLTTSDGYLMVGTMAGGNTVMLPLRIELPMVLNYEYKGGNNAGNGSSGWEVRAVAHSANVLSVAGSFNANTSHSSVLQYIKWYKPIKTIEKVDPKLVSVEENEVLILNEADWAGGGTVKTLLSGETWDTIKDKYSRIRMSAYSPRYNGEPVSWGFEVNTDTLKTGVNLDEQTDDGTARFKIENAGDGNLKNNSSSMAASDIKIYGIKKQYTVTKPEEAKVPTGYEVKLLEGTTSGETTDIINVALPAGKRIIGVMSIMIRFNSGWINPDTTGSIDWNYLLDTDTSIKIQGKTEHTKNKAYMITIQIADK